MDHLIIVGAGAAGLFAACRALEKGLRVTLVEHMEHPGIKLSITGKGRCNLTNDCDKDTFMQNVRHNPRFLFSSLDAFSSKDAMDYFENTLQVPLKTERGRRVFPQSDSAKEVVSALCKASSGAQKVRGQARELVLDQNRAVGVRLQDRRTILGDGVLIATGGASYPATGSTGLGYAMARQAGHMIISPEPSLVALVEKGSWSKQMMGLSLRNVRMTLYEDKKTVFSDLGEMIFTHFGLSGPLTLTASAYIRDFSKHSYRVSLDLKPALDPQKLDARIVRDFEAMPGKTAAHCLDKLLPASMRQPMLARWGVPPETRINQITRSQRRQLGELVKNFEIQIGGKGDLDHAVITSGGVCVKEVSPKTMESKKLPGLYFAGEVLDVDGYTGGYNLQIAWSTACAAVRGFAQTSGR